MKGLIIAFTAIVAVSYSAPSVRFTAKEYEALQTALGQRVPVAIVSAIRVLAAEETNPSDFVVLNFDGLSGASAAANQISARTGVAAPTEEDVAETFSEVAEEAVEDVQSAAADVAEEAEPEAVNRILQTEDTIAEPDVSEAAPVTDDATTATLTESAVTVTEDNTDPATDNAIESATAEETPETAAPTSTAAVSTTAVEATETSAGLAADSEVEEAPAAAEAAVQEATGGEVTPAQVIAQIESARRKRQNDDDDDDATKYANTLSFALQFLGLELGGNVGRFLDDIFNANLKFIENMQGTGELVLDQVDGFLESNRNKTKKSF